VETTGTFSQWSWGAYVVTKRLLLVAAVVALTGCSLKNQAAPSLTGPSEQALSMALSASPDIITQDGVSQSVIGVTTFDAHGQPLKGVSLRAQMSVNGVLADFGRLSTSTMSTDNAGHATLTYTAPAAPPATASSDNVVSIVVTPVGTNFDNTSDASKSVAIRLARPGVILPPQGAPGPSFFFSPTAPRENDTIQFDASSSTSAGTIVSYNWTFGDGGSGTGVRPTYRYALAGTYSVVLTITDDRGQTASTAPTPITIGASSDPTIVINVSPKSPVAGSAVSLTAAGSKAAPGHTINGYDWDFGDGSAHGSGVSVTHTYAKAGGYTVVVTVFDDQGRSTTGTVEVTVVTSGPTASFTNSSASLTASFNAAASSAIDGRTITAYDWDFGDGSPHASGVSASHTYASGGQFTVTLKVTDSAGQTGTIARSITITP
jgi:PKD repeat protein